MSLKSSCTSLRPPHLPIPDKDALHRSFNQLLTSLDLPYDKIEKMNSYDDRKKWEILCSRSLMKVHQSPSFYLQKMRSHVGLKTAQPKTDVTETLRGLEVSLRTYSIEWFQNFLREKQALDAFQKFIEANLSAPQFQIVTQCLKVILSNSLGFDMAINHPKLVDILVKQIALVSMRNRCNILQLLAMACKKSSKGHERILKSLKSCDGALDLLMDFLTLNSESEQMLMVATLNFIKVIVNSPIDLNYRVYLQFEFRQIGMESHIERLLLNESSLIAEVIEEIKSYESMIINVNQLVKDRDGVKVFEEAEAKLMDVERQSINCKGDSEVGEKDGRAEMSKSSKVDKVPDLDHRPEILLKSTVKISPMVKDDTEARITKKADTALVNPKLLPPPPLAQPPPPPPSMIPIKKKMKPTCNLPSFNWQPLRPNQIGGTVFYGLNDERLRKIINFAHFEDNFRLTDMSQSPQKSPLANRIRTPTFVTLLESTRLRNVSIALRKLNFDADVVIQAINDYDFNQLNLDSIELLTKLAPKDAETEAYRNYMAQKKDIAALSEGDKFIMKLSQVERLMTKLAVMELVVNFDRVAALKIQLCAITSASLSLKSSEKFKTILEIILTFGNYCNSNKSSSAAYGFRLKGTLERLSEIRTTDKKLTLFDYIVNETISKTIPHLLTLDEELLCIDEAAQTSMRSISSEVGNIKSGWRKLTEESKLSNSITLNTFVTTSSEEINKLINELEAAQNNYADCVRYFGEDATTLESDEFFSIVGKFVTQFKLSSGKVKHL